MDKDKINSRIKEVITNAMRGAYKIMHQIGDDNTVYAPPMLWHYTHSLAIESILKSKSIYVTQFKYLHDPSEIRLFGQIAKKIAKKRLKDLPPLKNSDLVKTPEQFQSGLWHIIAELDEMFLQIPICVACFSESGDLLSQWRAYADDCKGYAIGLSTDWLRDQTTSKEFPFRLLRVVYDPRKQIELVSTILDLIISEASVILSETDENDERDTIGLIIQFFQKLVAEFSPAIKHPSYSDEREWRLISFSESIDVRSVKGNFVQFSTVDLTDSEGKHPFREIKIGPRNNIENEKLSLKLLLKKIKLENEVQLSSSIIPIRTA
jgi:hypothetical protein